MQKLAFGASPTGQHFGTRATLPSSLNLLTLEQDLLDMHMRLHRVTVEQLDWSVVVKKYDRKHTLFYCDPPYWQVRGYGVDFGFEHYQKMLEMALSMEGKMLISCNDHPDIISLFKDLDPIAIKHSYQAGKVSTACVEMIFKNW